MNQKNPNLEKMRLKLHRCLHNLTNKHKILDRVPRDFGSGERLIGNEIHTIVTIGENPMMNISSLAVKMGITKAAASQAVRKLQEKGYVRKLRDDKNGKEILLMLTDKGVLAHEGHIAVWRKVCSEFLSDITEEQISAFIEVADRISASAEDSARIKD
jgi:DNA-binding MarR family transcriptional regulator